MTACNFWQRGKGAACAGFSYIWLLIMVAVMGVGLVAISEVYVTARQRDREAELLAIGEQFKSALASYYQAQLSPNGQGDGFFSSMPIEGLPASGAPPAAGGAGLGFWPGGSSQMQGMPPQLNPFAYPESLDELLQDNRFPGVRRHLRKVFLDPMTGKPEWGLVKVSGRIVGIHSLSTGVPIKQAGFDAGNQHFSGAQSYTDWVFGFADQMPLANGAGEWSDDAAISGKPPAAGMDALTRPFMSGDFHNATLH